MLVCMTIPTNMWFRMSVDHCMSTLTILQDYSILFYSYSLELFKHSLYVSVVMAVVKI